MNKTELFHKIYKKYGKEKCILLVLEELAELQQALCKNSNRDIENRDEILDEFADCLNIMEYIQVVYDINNSELADYKEKKFQEKVLPKIIEQL